MEMVVVLAVIAILAAILTPIINSYVDRARLNAASGDVKNIAAAIIQFNTDTRLWPIYTGTFTTLSGPSYDVLRSPGTTAVVGTGSGWDAGSLTTGDLDDALNTNAMGLTTTGRTAWKGAYLDLGADPWGTSYYLNAAALRPTSTNASFVVSAGPNQVLDTVMNQPRSGALTIGGDDIVQRIR
jgi:type II secretory pathway pseudopilin PulG